MQNLEEIWLVRKSDYLCIKYGKKMITDLFTFWFKMNMILEKFLSIETEAQAASMSLNS